MSLRNIVVIGGSGYIGSHCLIKLINDGFNVVAIDNLANSSKDINDKPSLDKIFKKFKFYAVLHLAAYKSVSESVEIPLEYYKVNVGGSIHVLEVLPDMTEFIFYFNEIIFNNKCMKENGVKNLVFSSSCTVYGSPQYFPIDETHPTGQNITNSYGMTKFVVEQMLKDLYRSDQSWNIIILRYFNPVGAHESGLIGEDPKSLTNIMPYISQVAVGRRSELKIFGNDYETQDGTAIRDYIHIDDLVSGHSLSIRKLEENPGLKIYNLGGGKGYSVLQIVKAFEKTCGREIPHIFTKRRIGDVAEVFANTSLAQKELGWKITKDLDDMCRDLWNWQSKFPNGSE